MNIGIDARMINHSGIGTYLRGLLQAFTTHHCLHLTLLGHRDKLAEFPWEVVDFPYPIYGLSEQWGYRNTLPHLNVDLLHIPHYNVPLRSLCPLVVTIHDVIHLKFPRSFAVYLYARTMLSLACHKARKIIVPSEHTKRDLFTHFKVPDERIRVIYHGTPSSTLKTSGTLSGITQPFFLYVGLLKESKNVPRLLQAYRLFRERVDASVSLLLVGRCTSARIQRAVHQQEGVRWLGEVAPETILGLYRKALALIFPSLYEGFGFPPLEAMACGTPVIVSRAASLPEVVGSAGRYIDDPYNVEEIVAAMETLYRDEPLRAALSQQGLERANRFRWEDTAAQTLQVYQEALAS